MGRGNRNNRTHSKKNIQNDGLRDALSGIGGEKDILATGVMGFANFVTRNYTMLQRMYRSNIWVKKAVSIPAQYAVKGWRKIEDEDFVKEEKRLNIKLKVAEALKWSALFGGSMAIMIVDDGLPPDKPLNINNIKKGAFKKIIIVNRWQVTHSTVNNDILSDNFMEPEIYLVTLGGKSYHFHASRCHKFIVNSLPYDEMVNEQYWGVSQIEIIYRQLINDDVFLSSIANMMKKATTDIVGIPNLANLITQGKETQISERIRIMHSTMSTLNAMVQDAGYNGQNAETYERITQNFSGFDAMDIQSLNRLAAAAEIPATIFLGKSPDGMNATGDSDLSIFSDRLVTHREIDIDPFLTKCDMIMAKSLEIEVPEYEWINPFPKSEKDEAEIRNINMDVINKMSMLELPGKIIATRMAEYSLIYGEDEIKSVINGFELEPFDIEEGELDEL